MIIKNTNKLIILIYVSAFLVVALSGYFSVVGISALFSGKKIFAAVMAISFELSKVTIISILSQKWDQIRKSIRTYMLMAAFFLVVISSSGIYSYLTDAYQLTLHKAIKSELKLQNISQKYNTLSSQKQQLTNQIKSIDSQIESINTASISLSKNITDRNVSIISSTQRQNTNTILQLQKQKTLLYNQIVKIDSSLSNYSDSKFEESTADQLKQVGPLKQMSILFNTSLDNVVKFFLFIIILIFDPIGIIFLNLINKLEIVKTNNKKQQFTVEKPNLPIVDVVFQNTEINQKQNQISTSDNNSNLYNDLNIEKDQMPENVKDSSLEEVLQETPVEQTEAETVPHSEISSSTPSPHQTIAIF